MIEFQRDMKQWVSAMLQAESPSEIKIHTVRQGWGYLQFSQSINKEPLNIHGRPFAWGLGSHGQSELEISGARMSRIQGFIGVDENAASRNSSEARLIFSIEAGGKVLWQSDTRTVRDEAVPFDVSLAENTVISLKCRDLRDNDLHLSHVDWAEPVITLTDGRIIKLGQLREGLCFEPRIPFSFRYGGRQSMDLLPGWQSSHKSKDQPNGTILHTSTWRDPSTGLECTLELTEFADFPAAEWVVRFRNGGDSDTPILQDINVLDLSGRTNRQVILHRSHGSHFSKDDFLYCQDVIAPGKSLVTTPVEGRSSTQWMPFCNVVLKVPPAEGMDFLQDSAKISPDSGLIIALGWSGSWKTSASLDRDGVLGFQAGFEKTHLTLHPGESIRTPSVLMMNWRGRPIDGNNMLRQFIRKYHRPVVAGELATVPLTNSTWGGMKTQDHLDRIADIAKRHLPYEYYWVDAGWYGPAESYSPDVFLGDWYKHVGNWSINPVAHPNGLKPIADAAHKAGMKFLLWFEPERAIWGTPVTREHPEWFLGSRIPGQNALLNLGDPAARKWATELIAGMIQQNGIDCYRQDFNMDPLPFWREADASDRVGMTEIRHIEGLYAFWDELRARFPNLLIDNCSSGGRRIDLETLSRSLPLWRSDVQCFVNYDTDCAQTQSDGLNRWVPLAACGTERLGGLSTQQATYRVRSSLSAGLVLHLAPDVNSPLSEQYPYEWHRKMMVEYLRARPMFYGDFYPLLQTSQSKLVWAAFQYHRGDLNQGIVQAFRRSQSPYALAVLPLEQLDVNGQYEFEDVDTGNCITIGGKELTDRGLAVTAEKPETAKMFFYRKLKGNMPTSGF